MMLLKKIGIAAIAGCIAVTTASAQDVNTLVQKVKSKLERVSNYVAEGRMRTDVTFIKAPAGRVKVLYKSPDKFKLKRDGGISLLPKGGVTVNMGSVLGAADYMALDAGESVLNGAKVRVVKLLPNSDKSDVVLTTLYIDEPNLLIKKATTTTRENGTYEINMEYGSFKEYALPSKVVFAFNTKDYKLPKGVTLEFDTSDKNAGADKLKNKKGRVEIVYYSYVINKGIPDSEFN